MKKEDVKNEACNIGNDSWELQHFTQLPNSASKQEQIEALSQDQRWQRDHVESTISQIDDLIQMIES